MWDEVLALSNNPVAYALPFFVLFIGMELASFRFLDHDGNAHESDRAPQRRTERGGDGGKTHGYHVRDTRTSLTMGAGSLIFYTLFKLLTLGLFVFLWAHVAPWQMPTDTWWSWALLLLAIDLAWYCNHRFSHRVRLGWAGHQAHHSSEFFNFGTALRQKWNPWSEAIFFAPVALLGFAPWTIYAAFGVNLVYQFFTHTETVGKLPRPYEFLFNTPSHHRVHHGSDPEYLDKNYAGILIVWDRVFGTFQEELHRPTYGLTTPVNTYNVFRLQYGEYGRIVRDVRGARRLRDKLGYVFGPPGWKPGDAGSPAEAGPTGVTPQPGVPH